MSGSRKDLDAPSFFFEVEAPFFGVDKGVGLFFCSPSFQQVSIIPGQEHREDVSLLSSGSKPIPSSPVVIVSMSEKDPLQNNSFACKPLGQSLAATGVDKECPIRVIAMSYQTASDGITSVAHGEREDRGREAHGGRGIRVKVQGGHRLPVKSQNLSEAGEIIGEGSGLA